MAVFKTIRQGYAGTEAELVQLALVRSGYLDGPPDGIFGPVTNAALLRFQRAQGLRADGVAGPAVWRALTPYLTGYFRRTVRPGDTFYSLAERFYTSLSAVETANPGADPFDLRVGSTVTIPFGFEVVPDSVQFTPSVLALTVEGLRARYPFLETGSIGKSVMGRDLYYIKIGSGENEVFYNASHHANEWITSPLLMRFIERYARAYSTGGRIFGTDAAALYRTASLYAVPMVNPDGVSLVTGELSEGAFYERALAISRDYPSIPFPNGWKANIEGVDPNLQYPAGWETAREIKFAQGFISPAPRDYVGSAPLAAPESRAVYDFTLRHDFSLTLSYHTQGRVIYWRYLDYNPPGSYEIALEFSAVSGYSVAQVPPESAYAGYKDWFILNYNRPGYTIEAGLGRAPLPISLLPEIYAENAGILTLGLTVTA